MNAQVQMLRAGDVAGMLGVSRRRVYQLAQTGKVPSLRQGRSVFIPLHAWEEWLRQQSAEALRRVECPPGVRGANRGR